MNSIMEDTMSVSLSQMKDILYSLAKPRLQSDSSRDLTKAILLYGSSNTNIDSLTSELAQLSRSLLLTTLWTRGQKTARCVPLRPFHDIIRDLLDLKSADMNANMSHLCNYVYNAPQVRRKSLWQGSDEEDVSERDRLPVQIRVSTTSPTASSFIQRLMPGWGEFESIRSLDRQNESDDVTEFYARNEINRIITSLLQAAARKAPLVIICSDVQYFDTASLALLLSLCGQVHPVVFIFAYDLTALDSLPYWCRTSTSFLQTYSESHNHMFKEWLARIRDTLPSLLFTVPESSEAVQEFINSSSVSKQLNLSEKVILSITQSCQGSMHHAQAMIAMQCLNPSQSDTPSLATLIDTCTKLIAKLSSHEQLLLYIAARLGAEFVTSQIEDVLTFLAKEAYDSLQNASIAQLVESSCQLFCDKLGLFTRITASSSCLSVDPTTEASPTKQPGHESLTLSTPPRQSATTLSPLVRTANFADAHPRGKIQLAPLDVSGSLPGAAESPSSARGNLQTALGITIPLPPKPLNRRHSTRKRLSQSSFCVSNPSPHEKVLPVTYRFVNEFWKDVSRKIVVADVGKVDQCILDHISASHGMLRPCWYFHIQDALSLAISIRDEAQVRLILGRMVDFLGTSTCGGLMEYAWWLGQYLETNIQSIHDPDQCQSFGRWYCESLSDLGFGTDPSTAKHLHFPNLTTSTSRPVVGKFHQAKFPYLVLHHFANWVVNSKTYLDNPIMQFPLEIRLPIPENAQYLSKPERERFESILHIDRHVERLVSLQKDTSSLRIRLLLEGIRKGESFHQATGILGRLYAQLGSDLHRQGHHRLGRRFLRLSTVLCRRSGDLPSLLFCFYLVGYAAIETASWNVLQESLEAAMSLHGSNSVSNPSTRFMSLCHESHARFAAAVASEYRGKYSLALSQFGELSQMSSSWKSSVSLLCDYLKSETIDLPPEKALCLIWGFSGTAIIYLLQGQVAEPIRLLASAHWQLERHVAFFPYEFVRVCAPLAVAKLRGGHPVQEIMDLLRQIDFGKVEEAISSPIGLTLLNPLSYLVEAYIGVWKKVETEKVQYSRLASEALRLLKIHSEKYPISLPRLYYWNGKYQHLSGRRNATLDHWKKSMIKARHLSLPLEEGIACLELALNFTHRELRNSESDNADLRHGVNASISYLQSATRIFNELSIPQLERIAIDALQAAYDETMHGQDHPTIRHESRLSQQAENQVNFVNSGDVLGREKQIQILKSALQDLNEFPLKPKVIVLEGDQGMGKSLVVKEVLETCDILDIPTVMAFCDYRDQRCPFYAWRPILLIAFGLDADFVHCEDRVRPKVLDTLKGIEQPAIYASLFNSLLYTSFPENEKITALSANAKQDKLMDLIYRIVMKAFSHQDEKLARPWVVILEDVHIMGDPSWSVLLRILQATAFISGPPGIQRLPRFIGQCIPIFFLLTARRVGEPPAGYQILEQIAEPRPIASSRVFFVSLPPIAELQTKTLVQSMLGNVAEDLVSYTHQTSGGNPSFVREIVRHLADSKSIHLFPSGQWHLIQTPSSLPEAMIAAMSERLDTLSAAQRNLLGFCAVFQSASTALQTGMSTNSASEIEFSTPLRFLVRAYDNDDGDQEEYIQPENSAENEAALMEDLKPDLKKMIYLGLISETTTNLMMHHDDHAREGETSYYLGHVLIQEWCYKMLSKSEQRRTHRLAGKWLESAPPDSIAMDYASFVAYHFYCANEPDRALYYLELAASRFLRRGMYQEMAHCMSEALSIGDKVGSTDQYRRAFWEIAFAQSCFGLGHLSRACRHAAEALRIMEFHFSSSLNIPSIVAKHRLVKRMFGTMPSKMPTAIRWHGPGNWMDVVITLKDIHPEFLQTIFGSRHPDLRMALVHALEIYANSRRYRNQADEYLRSTIATMNILQRRISTLGFQTPKDSWLQDQIIQCESYFRHALSVFGIDTVPMDLIPVISSPAIVVRQLIVAQHYLRQGLFEKTFEILKQILHACDELSCDPLWDEGMLLLGLTHKLLGNFPAAMQTLETLYHKVRGIGVKHVEICAQMELIDATLSTGGLGAVAGLLSAINEGLILHLS
eukprot:TRINITY_DN3807_c0_g1_i3.p1 TRINITY_DN3807_c0_g1~~TRINITY_DN3807_c0_g1_i3.p1  ORF type:complete len:2066 (+),score=339.42 TRINITY_DN3807_c0_g1_i3:162-6359(+)